MSESCWETGFQERLWGTFQSLLSMTGVVLWPFHPDVAHAELVTLSGFLCWKEGVLLGCSSYWNTERGSLLQGPPAWRVGNIHHWETLQMLLNAASAWVGWLCCCFNGTISFGLKMHIPGSNITLWTVHPEKIWFVPWCSGLTQLWAAAHSTDPAGAKRLRFAYYSSSGRFAV